jgi:hypothetical protein
VEKRKTEGGWAWTLGLRGKGKLAKSWLWTDASGRGLPGTWGSPPCLIRAVALYCDLLEEAAVLGAPTSEVNWHGLRAALARHPAHA